MGNSIYIIQVDKSVFGIGKYSNLNLEYNKFPKDSKLIFLQRVDDQQKCYKNIIDKLTKKFKIRSDIGPNYFEGDMIKIKKIVFMMSLEYSNEDKKFSKIPEEKFYDIFQEVLYSFFKENKYESMFILDIYNRYKSLINTEPMNRSDFIDGITLYTNYKNSAKRYSLNIDTVDIFKKMSNQSEKNVTPYELLKSLEDHLQ